jgi:FkbM family methyltransferase
MRRLYGIFLGPGDLAFDVGAHVGSRERAWRRLDARVVAIEPQPDCLRILRLFFGRDSRVTILPVAVGAKPGRARMALSSATPTVSSMSPDWVGSVTSDRSFARVRWDRSVDVEVTTLDELVARYGEPTFCKIDVEGFELEVLEGLSRPLRALSFEYLPPGTTPRAVWIGRRLGALGGLVVTFADRDDGRRDHWPDAVELVELSMGGPRSAVRRCLRLCPPLAEGSIMALESGLA